MATFATGGMRSATLARPYTALIDRLAEAKARRADTETLSRVRGARPSVTDSSELFPRPRTLATAALDTPRAPWRATSDSAPTVEGRFFTMFAYCWSWFAK